MHTYIHTTAFDTPVVEHWLEREIAQWVHPNPTTHRIMSERFYHGDGATSPPCVYLKFCICVFKVLYLKFWGAGRSSEVERSLMVRWVVGSILHGWTH